MTDRVDGLSAGLAESTLERLPLAVLTLDGDGKCVYANSAALALLDNDPDEGIARLTAKLLDPAGPVASSMASGAEASGEMLLPTDSGVIDRFVWVTPIDNDGARVSVVTFYGTPQHTAVEDAEREMRARLEAMLEHTTEIITVLDASGTVLFSNAASGRLTGFAGSEINGTSAFDLVHPEDRDMAAEKFLEALAQPGSVARAALRLRYADGEYHHVEVHVNNLLDDEHVKGLVVTIHDVTDRHRNERRLQQSEERHRSLIQNLTDVIVVLDRSFEVIYVSPAIERVIAAPADTNLGMSAFNDIHPDDVGEVVRVLGEVMDGPLDTTRVMELRLERRPGSGDWRWLHSTTVNRLDDPAVEGIVCTLRDITEQKAAAVELRAAYEREREAAERLRELDRLKDEFLSTVSHELRTPLTSIVGFSRLIAAGDVDKDMEGDLLRRIAANAAEMEVMVEQLLDFSSLEAGKTMVHPEPVDVGAAVTAAVDRLAHHLAAHETKLELADRLVATADTEGLGHVLRNLLTNAAKYSDAGTTITVRAERVGDEVVVSVQDEGAGIAAEVQGRVFERFYRAPDAAHAGRRGSGVGLNVVKRYSELMGGRVWLSSELGRGSTFFVALPAVEAASTA